MIRTVLAASRDDRTRLRHSLAELFRFDVVGGADDLAGALELLESLRPDVLLLDGQLGDVVSELPELVDASPETSIIVLTEGTGTAFRDDARRAGASAVLGKADPVDRLAGTVYKLRPDLAPAPAQAARPNVVAVPAAILEATPLVVERRRSSPDRSVRPWLIAAAIASLPAGAAAAYVIAMLLGLLR